MMKNRFSERISRGISLLLTTAVAITPISASGQDTRFVFRFATGSFKANLNLQTDEIQIGDIYVNEPFSYTLSAKGGTGNKTWTTIGAALPDGLTFHSSGNISGTPHADAVGTWNNMSFQATDELGQVVNIGPTSIRVLAPVTSSAAGGYAYVGESANFPFDTTGGRSPYSYSLITGNLPYGMSFSGGKVTGTPSAKGIFNATFRVTDANGRSDEVDIGIIVRERLLGSTELPDGYVGASYSGNLEAEGGEPPYSWQLLPSYNLPDGLSLASTGTVSGTPQAPATRHSFRTVLIDSTENQHETVTTEISVYSLPAISQIPLPTAAPGFPYQVSLSATGGKPTLKWDVESGLLPAGLTLTESGILSGTPATSGRFSTTFRVTDANGMSNSESFTLDVTDDLVVLVPTSLDAYVGESFNLIATANGGIAPYIWSVAAGVLPAGITLAADGRLSGTPTTAATSTFTVRATDANGTAATRSVTLTTWGTLMITSASPGNGAAGFAVANYQFVASGGKSPYTWSRSGSFPAGLTLSAAGLLSGTPTTAGTYAFTVTASDGNSIAKSQSVTMTINTPASCSLPWGGTLASGGSVTAFAALSVPYGQTCNSESRTCANGILSGSYNQKTCQVTAPKNCTVGTVSVPHGTTRRFYLNATVQCGFTQDRTCTNGVMSGSDSYHFDTCSKTGGR